MKLILVLSLCPCLLLAACQPRNAQSTPSSQKTTAETVGTYNRSELLPAFYGSKILQSQIQAMRAERDAALARGDQQAADALEAKGAALQDKAHAQMWSGAPLDNVLEALQPAMPEVCRELGVTRIVEDTEKLPKDVKRVDATPALIKHLPSAKPPTPAK